MERCGAPRPVKIKDDFYVSGDCSCAVDAVEKHEIHRCGGGMCEWPNVKTCLLCLVPVPKWDEALCCTCLMLLTSGGLLELARRTGVAGNWKLEQQLKARVSDALAQTARR